MKRIIGAGAVVVVASLAATPLLAQSGPLPASPGTGRARMSWVSCRVIAPATIQLIWRGVPWGARYEVGLSLIAGANVAIDTTADTTFTRASLPAGSFRIVVAPVVRGAVPLSATARVPLRGGSVPCGT